MTITNALLIGFVVLTAATGCASPIGSGAAADPSVRDNAAGVAAPPVRSQFPDCRNRGVYNRATNLCVSEGP